MNIYQQHKAFYGQPIRLSDDEKSDPLTVMRTFFAEVHLYEVKEHLASLLEIALTTGNDEFSEPNERAAITHFIQKLEGLVEAAFVLKNCK